MEPVREDGPVASLPGASRLRYRTWIPRLGKFFYWGHYIEAGQFFVGPPSDVTGIHQQFTGLKDKNGRDIYEGDIIKYSDPKHPYGPVEHIVGVVEFGTFDVDTGTMGHGMGSGSEKITGFYVRREYGIRPTLINGMESVVGNIYEAPQAAPAAPERSSAEGSHD